MPTPPPLALQVHRASLRPPCACLHTTLTPGCFPPPPLHQVLDEIGVDLGAQLGAAPKQRAPAQRQAAPAAAEEDELIARLTALK